MIRVRNYSRRKLAEPRNNKAPVLWVGLLILSACAAAPKWAHPTLPKDQWSLDASTCRAYADRQTEREMGRAETRFERRDSTLGRDSSLERDFRLFDIVRRRNVLFARCLEDRGYRRVEAGTKV